MITLQQAKERLFIALDAYRKEMDQFNNMRGPLDEKNAVEYQKTYDQARKKLDKISHELAAIPYLIPHLRLWMVDIHGKTEADKETVEKATEELFQTDNLTDAILEHNSKIGGNMRKQVLNLINQYRFTVSDSGAGLGCWDLGCHCTNEEADSLCALLHLTFAKAITTGYLKIERKPWTPGWKD